MPTLILTPRYSEDSQALWKAASQLGWSIERLKGWRAPDHWRSIDEAVLYVEALFGPTIASQLGIRLLNPAEDWLVRLPMEYKLRRIEMTTLGEARKRDLAAFIKPPNDKSFPAAVYLGRDLPTEYDEDMAVLVSDVVVWSMEFRCFLLNRNLLTYSIYARGGEIQRESLFQSTPDENHDLEQFVAGLIADPRVDLPAAAVVDVGYIEGRGWACVEQNAAWGAGIYGCDPSLALEVIRRASVSL
jgi:hypothetical protein